MKSRLQLNPDRLVLLLKHDFQKYWKKILMIIGGAFVASSVLALFFVITGDYALVANEMHTVLYPMILIWVGMFLVSMSFKDMNEDSERQNYLSLPASHLEKYTSRFILTGIVLPLFISIVYCIYAFFYDSVVLMALDDGIKRFSFFTNIFSGYTPTSFDFLKFYLPLHSVFFLGAITFRKLNFFKTLFSGISIIFMFVGMVYFFGKLLLPELYTGWAVLEGNIKVEPNEWMRVFFDDWGKDIFYGILMIIIPIVLWIVGYFKLTEKEA